MSGISVIATSLHCASRLLGRYNLALESVGSRGGSVARADEARSLLAVLGPLGRHLRGETYYALGVHAEEMSEFLRLRHRDDWPGARDCILSVASRLEGDGRVALSDGDLSVLGDISDALDGECSSLFMEMRERRTPAVRGAPSWGGSPGPSR